MGTADDGGCDGDTLHMPQVPAEVYYDQEIDKTMPKQLEGTCHAVILIIIITHIACSLTCNNDVHEDITMTQEDSRQSKDLEAVRTGTYAYVYTRDTYRMVVEGKPFE